ncbi:MAG: signal recognition particle protein [Planctomycetota bacterium]|nr:MAG: signal recognition particle protein [Planctomycetota bacterium]REJ95581.1 MAG: signal recognition particle protein [Planctomycetota bacterium]REK21990.1 MAG: signal recognition particle protein [Planctomycetota bacterium]REK31262.1 MAG: signal recognition particle protein [Planctomycetota bacterium]
MFESITQSLTDAIGTMTRGRLTESNIRDGMRKVRQALLEADVNYDVAKSFTDRVTEQAVGDQVLKSLKPEQQIVGIVYQELVNLMGPAESGIDLRRGEMTVLMMCGLQGSGKTTTCGKLARMLREQGAKPMLVAADLQRPAAIEQLKVIGEQIDVPVYSEPPSESTPVKVCTNGRKEANKQGCDVLILDTAGRLHVDDELMGELTRIDNKLMPHQALLVCDAMTGQDAVNSAKSFNEALELDGVILTKLDGDTRGGAALSVKAVTGVPIKFIGVGEQLDRLEPFYADRMAQRILGHGDVATLLETAQRVLDQEEMAAQQEKMLAGKFTLDDFLKAMSQIKKLGSMGGLLKMLPGGGQMAQAMEAMDGADPDRDLGRVEAMIRSMTLDERQNPDRIDRSRRNRIARGSGTDPAEVHDLLKQFDGMAGMMQQMAGLSKKDQLRQVQAMQKEMVNPGASIHRKKERSKRGPTDKNVIKDRRKQERKRAKDARKKNRRRR